MSSSFVDSPAIAEGAGLSRRAPSPKTGSYGATDAAPHWIHKKGFYDECSVCGRDIHRAAREDHAHWCWAHRQGLLSITNVCSFERPEESNESPIEDHPSDTAALTGEACSPGRACRSCGVAAGFALTDCDCASFNGTLRQTYSRSEEQATTWEPAIEPYSIEYSTTNEEDAMSWLSDGDCEKIPSAYQPWKVLEDRPNGSYVKAMFSLSCENPNEKNKKLAILIESIKNHLKASIDCKTVEMISGFSEGKRACERSVYVILPGYCVESSGRNLYRYGCESLHNNHVAYGECSYMPFDEGHLMMGFVKKGTPIIPKEMAQSIKATALSTDDSAVAGNTLIREFIAANIDTLKTGKEFTYKALEEFGMMEVFDTVYPEDADNRRHKLGKVLNEYCGKPRKGHSREGAYRNHYKLLPERIREFL